MNFTDSTVVRLADPTVRATLFDQTALEQLSAAAYDTETQPLEGPYSALFDEFRLGVGLAPPIRVAGRAEQITAGRWELSLEARDLELSPVRVDALWRGAIIARTSLARSVIERVQVHWPELVKVDGAIVAELGALPTDPLLLEAARRAGLLSTLRAQVNLSEGLDEAALDRTLARFELRSVAELLMLGAAGVAIGALEVSFSAPAQSPPSPYRLPVSVALLIRDSSVSIAGLLAESKRVRRTLEASGSDVAPDRALERRVAVVVAWVLPASTFDDPGWPGGDSATSDEARRALRRQAAGAWLAREGIGLVVV